MTSTTRSQAVLVLIARSRFAGVNSGGRSSNRKLSVITGCPAFAGHDKERATRWVSANPHAIALPTVGEFLPG
jgi:hypothetical protein